MIQLISNNIWKILACPNCGQSLRDVGDHGAECIDCGRFYQYTNSGSLDLRLYAPKNYHLEFRLGSHLPSEEGIEYQPLVVNPAPDVDFSRMVVPYHLSREMITHFPKAKSQGSLMLDLGCGGAIHQEVCEYAGFEYVGMDYDTPKAPILGDAHALPFLDNSFEFILSIAVLEHIRYPFVMTTEAFRVLQRNGIFIGTVAFLEPFHLDSYYHHSHLGILNSLQFSGFKVTHIAPHADWSVLNAQAVMSLFQRLPRRLSKAIVYPVQLLSNLWWRTRQYKNRGRDIKIEDRVRNTTGAFTFIAIKEGNKEPLS